MMNEAMEPNDNQAGDNPTEEAGDGQEQGGYAICINVHADGSYDVYSEPMESVSEKDHPDGMFGLSSLEESLKAVIAISKQGPDFQSAEEQGMLQGFGGEREDG